MYRHGETKDECDREKHNYLNYGEDDQMEIVGYRHNICKTIITWVLIVLTGGLLRLFFFWIPRYMTAAMNTVCNLNEADIVVLKDAFDQWFVSNVHMATTTGQIIPNRLANITYATGNTTDPTGSVKSTQISFDAVRYFITKKVKYIWDYEEQRFVKIKGMAEEVPCNHFHQQQGLSYAEQCARRAKYGINSIRIHVTPIVVILFNEVLSPFYIFQVFSVCVWFYEKYREYAVCIIVISILSITVTIYQTRKMQRALRNTIHTSSSVSICRGNNDYDQVSSEDLVPGDVIEIPRGGCIMQCDAVLVNGNCIVNESMLTGESVPVTKTPIPNPNTGQNDGNVIYFNIKEHARHVLFCGTRVIQTRYYGGQRVTAVVFRTGFSTAKGELVRSILYPKPVDFKFTRHSYYFVGVLAFAAMVGFIYTITMMVLRGEDTDTVIVRACDLITIAIPPALPAALSVGIVFAQRRMKVAQIYCISPRSINMCGSIDIVCFDKTGTLTEEGLDMHSVVPVNSGRFEPAIQDLKRVSHGHFLYAMATCHSLTIIDGVLSGDPLELVMINSVEWELTEPGPDEHSRFDMLCPTIVYPKSKQLTSSFDLESGKMSSSEQIGIVRQFTFSSSLQRMSVIVRQLGADHFDIYSKGAPEMIASLCAADSVPKDFPDKLNSYTRHGYRVLAVAYKPLPVRVTYTKVQRIDRERVERDLIFLGLIVMENRIKPETGPAIKILKEANIRSVMVTGDNMLTAMSVARECGFLELYQHIILVQAYPKQTDAMGNTTKPSSLEYIMEQQDRNGSVSRSGELNTDMSVIDILCGATMEYRFAVSGKSWSVLSKDFPDELKKIVVRGTIFARMSPDQKAQLVECLQGLGYYVGMCGDGANDCGALKAAHAGVSLSEAEASVASPFTSKMANISCIPTIIKEGRAALVTSFGVFKYMACYSLTQFFSACILYWVGSNLSNYEYLFIDFGLLTILSLTSGWTRAHNEISPEPPLISLMTLTPVLSFIVHLIIIFGFQIFFYFIVQKAEWFVPFKLDPDIVSKLECYENTAVFYASLYQYIILAIVFSRGMPYRATMFTNFYFMGYLFLCFAICTWMIVYPVDGMVALFELRPFPSIIYRLIFVGSGILNFFVAFIVEMFVIESKLLSVTLQKKFERLLPGAVPEHEKLEEELCACPSWPPATTNELGDVFQTLDQPAVTHVSNTSQMPFSDTISLGSGDIIVVDDVTELLNRENHDQTGIDNPVCNLDAEDMTDEFVGGLLHQTRL